MLLDSMKGMNSIYDRLKYFLTSDDKTIEIASSPGGEPEPYEELLGGIEIEKSEGPVSLSLTNRRWLRLVGATEHLMRYISHFQFKENEEGNHHHPEFVKAAGYIARGAMKLIIEVDSERIEDIEKKR
jgi:hypothetical protein